MWYNVIKGNDFNFFIVSDRGEWQLPGTFFGIEKYCSLSKLPHFEISKIQTITFRAQTLIAIPRKSTLNSSSSYSFYGKCLNLGSYGLRTIKHNFCSVAIFLGLLARIYSLLKTKSKLRLHTNYVLAPRTKLQSVKHLPQKLLEE